MYDDIFLFIKLVDVGTFNATAKALNTSQGAISRRINNLEDSLKLQLLKRDSRGVFDVTPDGQLIYDKFNVYKDHFQNALNDIAGMKAITRGTLRIAISPYVYMKIIAPRLHEFTQMYPEAKLLFFVTNDKIKLLQNNFDIAISGMLPSSQNSKVKLLLKSKLKLYATVDYIEKYGEPALIEELSSHNIAGIINDEGSVTEYQICEIATNHYSVLNFNSQVLLNNPAFALTTALEGHFITVTLESLVKKELENGVLKPILAQYHLGERKLYLIRTNGVSTQLENAFIKFISSCFEIE